MKTLRGFTMIAIAALVALSVLSLSATRIVDSISETSRVRIHETNKTERTRIEWTARVQIADIKGRAKVQSSWAGVANKTIPIMILGMVVMLIFSAMIHANEYIKNKT